MSKVYFCEHCGKEFAPVYDDPDGIFKYCSLKCRHLAENKRTATLEVCPVCGKSFLSRTYGKKYCSVDCSKRPSRYLGMTSDLWREYIQEKYDFTCQDCRERCEIRSLNVHHKIPLCRGGSNAETNLTLLCLRCHKKAHLEVSRKAARKTGSAKHSA